MATAAQLLLGLWVTEEGRLNVTRVNQGLLNSLETPLGALAGQAGDGGKGAPARARRVGGARWRSAPEVHDLHEVIGTREQVLACIRIQRWRRRTTQHGLVLDRRVAAITCGDQAADPEA